MRKLLLVLFSLFVTGEAYSQAPPFIYRPTPYAIGCAPGAPGCSTSALTDNFGRIQIGSSGGTGLGSSVIPVSGATNFNGIPISGMAYFVVGTDTIEAASTTTVLNLTAHVARIGDTVTTVTGGTAANVNVEVPICSVATDTVTLCFALPATPSTDNITIRRPRTFFAPLEDSAHVSGDPGFQVLGVRNSTLGAIAGTDLDYSPFATDIAGRVAVNLSILNYPGADVGFQPVRAEDDAFGSSNALMMAGAVFRSAAINTTGTTGDATSLMVDERGALVGSLATPAETWQACSASNTGTSDTAIKAAVASNRIYVTSISCFNTASVASAIAFKDGSTQIYVGGIGNSTLNGVAHWQHTLTVPLRGTVNTAFNFAMATNATATTCCAAGYISTI